MLCGTSSVLRAMRACCVLRVVSICCENVLHGAGAGVRVWVRVRVLVLVRMREWRGHGCGCVGLTTMSKTLVMPWRRISSTMENFCHIRKLPY